MDFNAAFGVFIDRVTDEVYISDTTRHLLRKFAPDGQQLAVSEETFKFPNQLMLHEGSLHVADTNNHVVRIVAADTASYGNIVDSFNVVPGGARLVDQRWPSHFARASAKPGG